MFLQGRFLPPGNVDSEAGRARNNLDASWRIRWHYQKWFAVGWDSLLLALSGSVHGGDTIFPQDDPVGGKYLRGVFGRQFYVRKVGAGTVEYRFSVTRDLAMLGLFLDVAGFEPQTEGTNGYKLKRLRTNLVFGSSTGAAIHTLIGGMFQLTAYGAYGATYNGRIADSETAKGFGLKLKKVF